MFNVPYVQLSNSFTDHIINGILGLLPKLPNVPFDLLLGILVVRLLVRLLRYLMKSFGVQPGLRGVLGSLVESFLWLFLTITLLTELGFPNILVFFTGSIAAIGLALAAGGSTLVSDIVAGVFLARDIDFNVGDEVIVGETPTHGIIERMDARRTRIRDEYGVLHVIPNSVVERKEWVVIRKRPEVNALVKATKAAQRLTQAAREKQLITTPKTTRIRKND
jgi:small-conductance mechanosensitive channel